MSNFHEPYDSSFSFSNMTPKDLNHHCESLNLRLKKKSLHSSLTKGIFNEYQTKIENMNRFSLISLSYFHPSVCMTSSDDMNGKSLKWFILENSYRCKIIPKECLDQEKSSHFLAVSWTKIAFHGMSVFCIDHGIGPLCSLSFLLPEEEKNTFNQLML